MDALAALGLVCNILQLVEVSTKLVKTTIKLTGSASGVPDEINDAIVIRDTLVSLLQKVGAPGTVSSKHDQQLAVLAENCRKICQELLDQVNRIKGKGNASKTGAFGVAWRTLTDGGKLNSIAQRLDQYRSQVIAHVIFMLDHKQSATYTLIESSIKQNDAHARSLQELIIKNRDEIIDTIQSESINSGSSTGEFQAQSVPDTTPATPSLGGTIVEHPTHGKAHCSNETSEAQLDILVAVRTALTAITQASKAITIQDWLSFPELLSRENTIRDRHKDTYSWLLHDENHSEDDSEYDYKVKRDLDMWSQKRHEMCNWLESGRGIFYISGKAGSGKSTLMKYLAGSPQAREHLTHWAKTTGKDLIFAGFFFWRSGAPLERDIEGLYRGILWKILDAHPDFIQHVFPALWRDRNGDFGDRTRGTTEPMLSELEAAFDILINSPRALSRHKVCLFIDGLDEFEGDYWRLSQRLVKWCASDDIKLCVSSRPKNEFSKAFDKVPGAIRLCLHELTRTDMLHFVRDTFEKDQRYADACADNSECASLSRSIVYRADGVFLWVQLVVNELLVGMGNSWSLVQLQQRLDEVPNDLRLLFGQMLGRIDRLDRMKLISSFMVLRLSTLGIFGYMGDIQSTVSAHAILDDLADNPDPEIQLLDGSLDPYLSDDQCISKCSQMCRRLIGRCQGLLDVYETGQPFPHIPFFCSC
ncbi:hypothetical protein F4803DRAFT_269231 [Xylaria telfairii]|nr:hypothetical protein F4803DRAFT_269231 [Xylaria telfairii]